METENSNEDETFILLSNQQRIIQFIVTSILPERIFLINHLNNDEGKEFFDFIIEYRTPRKRLLKNMNKLFLLQVCKIVLFIFLFINQAS